MNIYCIHENKDEFLLRKHLILEQLNQIPESFNLEWVTSYPASFFSSDNLDLKNQLHSFARAPVKSCFWKHYDALKKVADSGAVGLIIEDDSIFKSDVLSDVAVLLGKLKSDNFYINIEYSSYDVPLNYIHKSLVKMKGTKRTGAYIVSPIAAKKLCSIVDNYLENKESFDYASDSFVTAVWNDAGINVYWSVKPIVWQGSKTGRFSSDLSGRRENVFSFFYEKALFNLMPFINKVRALFRKKIKVRILDAI
ncbi:hypothetical protein [Vibrio sp. Y29_XK_CS5]|uniref:hypothetical protein n=1 Tax=Vibrio sp. Y29_XK_CS5 TaxID=2957762 RepID=UPI0020A3D804|nr:hypothetical protein [Vibrio sp. Y29_XK_CS5]